MSLQVTYQISCLNSQWFIFYSHQNGASCYITDSLINSQIRDLLNKGFCRLLFYQLKDAKLGTIINCIRIRKCVKFDFSQLIKKFGYGNFKQPTPNPLLITALTTSLHTRNEKIISDCISKRKIGMWLIEKCDLIHVQFQFLTVATSDLETLSIAR